MVTSAPRDVKALIELRKYEGAVYAENLTFKPVLINDPEREVKFDLGPEGKDNSIQILPPRALEVPGFTRAVQRGEVRLSTDIDEMEAKLANLATNEMLRANQQRQELMSMAEESSSQKDVSGNAVKCLVSGVDVYQTVQEQQDGIPPLAPQFKHLQHQFILSGKNEDGSNNFMRIST